MNAEQREEFRKEMVTSSEVGVETARKVLELLDQVDWLEGQLRQIVTHD